MDSKYFSRTCLAATLSILLLCAMVHADDLTAGVLRGPLLHEHSFQAPLVNDWWEEGVPHFMIGGSTIANERFLRLTTNNLDDSGFAFNTAPMDHDNWEARVRFSVRPPPPALQAKNSSGVKYQGGEGLALWYLDQTIGDDHQHVLKYSKSISPELDTELKDTENPWRLVDLLLNTADDENDLLDGVAEEDLTETERNERRAARERREEKRKKREEQFRRIFKRGTSVDDSDAEPRIMGVKYSDFTKGFAIVLDSVGDEAAHLEEHKGKGDAVEHHHHKPKISLLLNLPNHTSSSDEAVKNNFFSTKSNFRQLPTVLQCEYDFRQEPSKSIQMEAANTDAEAKALSSPEEPVELIVRYYKKKLSVIIRRENVAKRTVIQAANDEIAEQDRKVELQHTYLETLCGEVYPLTIPIKYHFGLSASTGRRSHKQRKEEEGLYHRKSSDISMHVDVHDVFSFGLRELGTDPKAMGYSKSIPIEHFDYNQDKREREHFSRQVPVDPGQDI